MDKAGVEKHKILILDDESDIVDTLSMLVKKCGYKYRGVTNPLEAISIMDSEYYDLMLLDYKMSPINGDEVIKRIREKGIDTYIILLTGYSDILPPIEALKNYDIQLYWEKSDDLGQVQLLIEAGIKALNLSRKNHKTMTGLENIIQSVPDIYKLRSIDIVLEKILDGIVSLTKIKHAFILADVDKPIYKGVGNYDNAIEDLAGKIDPFLMEQIGFARANKNMVINENSIYFLL